MRLIARDTLTPRGEASGQILYCFSAVMMVFTLGWIGGQSRSAPNSSLLSKAGSNAETGYAAEGQPIVGKTPTNQTEEILLVPIPAPTDLAPNSPGRSGESRPRTTSLPTPASLTNGVGPNSTDERTWRVLDAQLVMARQGISSGSFDGMVGPQTRAALRSFFKKTGQTWNGESNAVEDVRQRLDVPRFKNYTFSDEDLASLLPLGKTWLAKSQQERLDFETALELVAEKSQSHPNLIRSLNPRIDWNHVAAGTVLTVPNAGYPPPRAKAAWITIYLSARVLEAFDENTNLFAHFPCSIASRVEKRPIGEDLHVAVVAPRPNYTFDPAVFPESEEARELGRKLILPPGPNNPVGLAWIGLDKTGYGIHGTPRPEDVGRTESHGCFRLANWNAEYLLKSVWVGLPVVVEP